MAASLDSIHNTTSVLDSLRNDNVNKADITSVTVNDVVFSQRIGSDRTLYLVYPKEDSHTRQVVGEDYVEIELYKGYLSIHSIDEELTDDVYEDEVRTKKALNFVKTEIDALKKSSYEMNRKLHDYYNQLKVVIPRNQENIKKNINELMVHLKGINTELAKWEHTQQVLSIRMKEIDEFLWH